MLGRMVGSITALAQPRAERRANRLARLLATLISERGEASGAVMARRAVALYKGLDEAGRRHFFDLLARDFSPNPREVLSAAEAYYKAPTPANLAFLQFVSEPPRQEVFRRMNMAPGGTETLVSLRTALLKELKAHPEYVVIDHDLQHLLGSWFNRGFLELRRIDWNTPAAILEKLIQYEAVHAIQGFPDLKRRLAADRRCFGFFHPALPDDPLIFVEVAFTDELPSAVAPILSLDSAIGDPRRARCAIFYSITNCQEGLRGISFGNFLIKQVAADLQAELPNLRIFATLSPVPGFMKWLTRRVGERQAWADDTTRQAVSGLLTRQGLPPPESSERVDQLLAWYLTREWESGHSRDPVARFHLGNGARLERINRAADLSTKGVAQSLGFMVNYLYDLSDVEANHEAYVNDHKVAASGVVERAARAAESLWAEPDTEKSRGR
ncbi:MAG: malonyl-CoA decarboxylase [Betaproteobacteria bacterium]|nr:malonyl-CoA decarboxylase [Betaproteobacteria bacterium]